MQSVIIGGIASLIALLLWAFGWFDAWEAKTWDWRASLLSGPGKATADITLILVDQKSLDWVQTENGLNWPWPREIYSAIVNYCQRNGARAVAFDILFEDPSRYGVEDDIAFGSAVSAFGHVALATSLGEESGQSRQWPDGIPRPAFKVSGLNQWLEFTGTRKKVFPLANLPIGEISKGAAVLCNVSQNPDSDGIYRRVKPVGIFDDQVLPSLGLGLFLAAEPDISLQFSRKELAAGNKSIPLDRNGYAILRFRGPSGTHRVYSAAAVLQSEIRHMEAEAPGIKKSEDFENKFVIVGLSAPGLYDLRPTPVAGVYPGAEIYATMLDNFLSEDFLQPAPVWITPLWVIFLGLLCAFSIIYLNRPGYKSAAIVGYLLLPVGLSLLGYAAGYWLPLIAPEAAAAATAGAALVVNYATEGRQKRFIKSAFSQYLSPKVIEQLIEQPDLLELGGTRKVLSIFFSDIQGFTSISEKLAPEALVELLNQYLSAMTDIIHEEGGTIDKYEGDAIIAFWNAPLDVADHALRAVRAALRCQAKLKEMCPQFREHIGQDILMRVGVNSGPAVVGNMGSRSRFDYTIIGDAVNLASRLEGANKHFGTYTMISQSTRELIQEQYSVRELARLMVVGRSEPVRVYEPMDLEDYKSRRALFDKFERGLSLFYKGDFKSAMDSFNDTHKQDPAAAAYNEKCRSLLNTELPDWQGVWELKTK